MNLILDTLKTRRSLRVCGELLGLIAGFGAFKFVIGLSFSDMPVVLAAGGLLAIELVLALFNFPLRRLKGLAPRAFPFKNLLPEEREFLQNILLRMPLHEAATTLAVWLLLLGIGIAAYGFPGFESLLCGALGACVALQLILCGQLYMSRRIALFCYFEGDYPEELAERMSSWWIRLLLPALAWIFPLKILTLKALGEGALSLSGLFWILLWAFAGSLGAFWVLKDLYVQPLKDLDAALQRLGKGDFSGLLDVSAGDLIGVLSQRFNRTLRQIDLRFFVKERFGFLLPDSQNERLLESGLKLDGEEREIGVIACRLEGTSIPLATYNKFSQCVLDLAEPKGAALDELSPGLVVLLLNAPLPLEGAESLGRDLSEEIRQRLTVFCAQQKMQNNLEFRFRVGFSYGKATLGLVGPKGRQRYTALNGAALEARQQVLGH